MAVSNTIYLYEWQTGRRLVQDDSTPARELERVAWSPAGDRIVTGHGDGIVRVWDAATGELIWHKAPAAEAMPGSGSGQVSFVEFSSDGRRVIVAGDRVRPRPRSPWHRRDLRRGQRHDRCARSDEGFGEVAISPDGRMMFGDRVGSPDQRHGILVGIETETGRELWQTVLAKEEIWRQSLGRLGWAVAVPAGFECRGGGDAG